MPNYTVSDDVLHSAAAKDYFNRADRRVKVGLRVALNMLGIPEPEYAYRRKPGCTPGKAVLAAFAADHPKQFSTALPPRRANASPDQIIAACVRHSTQT